MQYGICHLSIVPLRFEATDKSELVSQLLYGDYFKVLEQRKHWSKIRLAFDNYEGWIDNKQFRFISEEVHSFGKKSKPLLSGDLIDFVTTSEGKLLSIITRYLLRSTTLGICSTNTGHCSIQAIQLVHDQSSSAVTALPIMGVSA